MVTLTATQRKAGSKKRLNKNNRKKKAQKSQKQVQDAAQTPALQHQEKHDNGVDDEVQEQHVEKTNREKLRERMVLMRKMRQVGAAAPQMHQVAKTAGWDAVSSMMTSAEEKGIDMTPSGGNRKKTKAVASEMLQMLPDSASIDQVSKMMRQTGQDVSQINNLVASSKKQSEKARREEQQRLLATKLYVPAAERDSTADMVVGVVGDTADDIKNRDSRQDTESLFNPIQIETQNIFAGQKGQRVDTSSRGQPTVADLLSDLPRPEDL